MNLTLVFLILYIRIPIYQTICADTNCEQCTTNESQCETCKLQYYLNSGNCAHCQEPCSQCYTSSVSCTVCVDPANQSIPTCSCQDITLSIDTHYDHHCRKCHYYCLTCNSIYNCTSCIDGNYLSGNTCPFCQGPCKTCINSSTNCITCKDSTKQNPAPQCDCISNTRYMSVGGYCLLCINHCATCTTMTDCITCVSDEYYLQGTHCINCTKPCVTCSGSLINCTTCIDTSNQNPPTCACNTQNKYLDSTTFKCEPCVSPCVNCISQTSCLSCINIYFLSGASCVPCIKPCQECSGSGNNCTQCVDSINQSIPNCSCSLNIQYMDNTSYNCLSCVSPCLTCSSASSCLFCISNYFLSGTYCLLCTKPCDKCSGSSTNCSTCIDINQTPPQCNCNSEYLMNSTTKLCDICTFPCATCQFTITYCLSCASTYTYDSITNTCKCFSNQFEQFGSPNTCQNCQSPCSTCQTTNTNCNSCISGINRHLQTHQCICDDGFYDDGIDCQNCILPCINCISQTICNTCNDSLQIIPDCQCPSQYLMDSITKQCNPCTFPCLTCQITTTTCSSCAPTYTHTSPDNTCTCLNNQFKELGTTSICKECLSPCFGCIDNSTKCTSCISGLNRHFLNNQCVCDAGYFENLEICVSCVLPCITCTALSICLTCNGLHQSLPDCSCQPTYYQDTSYLCQTCQLPCRECTGPQYCTSCANPNQFLNENNCICDEGYYMDTSYYCQLFGTDCQEPCLKCTYPNYCTYCISGHFLDNDGICMECESNCKKCNDSNICEYCEDGYFIENYNCSKCSENCLTCFDQIDNCQSCKPNEQLIENKCHCDSNTIKSSTDTCIQCEYPCLVCLNQDQCIQCASLDGIYLNSQNQCVCEDTYIWQENQCQILCPNFCLQCLDGICYECKDKYSLNNNKCIQIQPCGNGQLDEQEQCDDMNNNLNDGCFKCKIEENWLCNQETPTSCAFYESPYMILTYLNQTSSIQYVNLEFSSEIRTNPNSNLTQNIEVSVLNLSTENYFITIYSIKEATDILSFAQYQIAVDIQVLLQEKPSLNINILLDLYNEYEIPLETKSAEIQLKIPKYLNPEQKSKAETMTSTNSNIIYGLGAISVLSIFMGEAAIFQEILKLLQYQSYLKYINLDYPENLEMFFQSTNIVSVSAIVKYTNLNYYLNKYSLKQGLLPTDGKFAFYKYDADLITNLSCQFMQLIGLVTVGFVTQTLERKFYDRKNIIQYLTCISEKKQSQSKFMLTFQKTLYSIIKSVFKGSKQFSKQGLRSLFLINSQDLLFKSLIYLHYMEFNTIRNYIQASLALSIFGSYLFLMFFTLSSNNFLFSLKKEEQIQLKFDIITLARQTSFLTLLVFAQSNQILQTVLISLINISYFVIVKRKRMMLKQFNYIQQSIEVMVLLFTLLSFLYFDDLGKYFKEETKILIAWVQIALLSLSLLAEASKFIIAKSQSLIKYIQDKIKESQQKKKTDPLKQFYLIEM